MKNKSNDIGILINKKIPKIHLTNTYYRSTNIEFTGKAYLVENNEKTEIKSPYKIKKAGSYEIDFIDNNDKVFIINLKLTNLIKQLLFLILSIITITTITFIAMFNYKNNDELDLNKDIIFEIGLSAEQEFNFTEIDLFKNVANNKIAPGMEFNFNIVLSNKNYSELEYEVKILEEIDKPTNLKFKINDEEYSSFTELAENELNGQLKGNSTKKVEVFCNWPFETNNDVVDTNVGKDGGTYKIKTQVIGKEEL